MLRKISPQRRREFTKAQRTKLCRYILQPVMGSVQLAIMMRRRSTRIIAIVLVAVAALATLLGFDLVYQSTLSDTFYEKRGTLDDM